MNKLRVALLGAGFMGRAHSNAYRQAPFFFKLPYELEMAVLCGRDLAKLQAAAAQWGWREVSTDWRAVIARPDIDIVDIALPNARHAEIAIAAAQAGKIVLVEKPLAVSLADAERMVLTAAGVPNGVWFNYRQAPAVQLARKMIDEGLVGRVYHFRAQYLQEWGIDSSRPASWKTDRAIAGGGVALDLMSHSIDAALWLNGPIAEIRSLHATFAPGRDVDDAAAAAVRFANGSIGTLEASRYATGYRNRNFFEIQGSKGMLRFDLEDFNALTYAESDGSGIRRRIAPTEFWKPGHPAGYEHTFIATLRQFLIALKKGDPLSPGFGDGLEAQRVLDRIIPGDAS
ncbi:MAG: Gfo/Idh/MocA family oxidoreductase [Bryobacteraceae bacterium]|nr:Gfo/Idh/MocA family oxidoreductase [Bryobacteraceae bacterium]